MKSNSAGLCVSMNFRPCMCIWRNEWRVHPLTWNILHTHTHTHTTVINVESSNLSRGEWLLLLITHLSKRWVITVENKKARGYEVIHSLGNNKNPQDVLFLRSDGLFICFLVRVVPRWFLWFSWPILVVPLYFTFCIICLCGTWWVFMFELPQSLYSS
jgi:hypothetical protein